MELGRNLLCSLFSPASIACMNLSEILSIFKARNLHKLLSNQIIKIMEVIGGSVAQWITHWTSREDYGSNPAHLQNLPQEIVSGCEGAQPLPCSW